MTITANGNVTGTNTAGIFGQNSAIGTDLTVTIAADTSAKGGLNDIFVRSARQRAWIADLDFRFRRLSC
jgi:hypothetical protein